MSNEKHEGTAAGSGEADLAASLRRAAAEVPITAAPVEAVLRAGRSRRRRRQVAAGVAVLAVITAPTVLVGVRATPQPVADAPPAVASPSPRTPPSPRIVEPGEAVAVSADWRLALLAEGNQNSVFARRGQFAEALDRAGRSPEMGANIRPRSISSGRQSDEADRSHWIEGVWRLDEPPSRIVITVAGQDHAADLYMLRGDPGWGVYLLQASEVPRSGTYTVTAYDADGEVFDTLHVEEWDGPRSSPDGR